MRTADYTRSLFKACKERRVLKVAPDAPSRLNGIILGDSEGYVEFRIPSKRAVSWQPAPRIVEVALLTDSDEKTGQRKPEILHLSRIINALLQE